MDIRDTQFVIRVNRRERQAIIKEAHRQGLSISAFLRQLLLTAIPERQTGAE